MNTTKVLEKAEQDYPMRQRRQDFRTLYARMVDGERLTGPYFSKPASLGVRLDVSKQTLLKWAREDGVLRATDVLAEYLPARLDMMGSGLGVKPKSSQQKFWADVDKGKNCSASKLFDLGCMDWFNGGKA